MAKLNVRYFKATNGDVLAVVNSEPKQFLVKLVKTIAYIDVDVTELGAYSSVTKTILNPITDVSKVGILIGTIDSFEGDEVFIRGNEMFDIKLDKTKFLLSEKTSMIGSVRKRKFSYDFTNPEIIEIAKENDARLNYYVKPHYFDFLKSNVENSFIKGMALIGVPGTGKSTDAIAVIRELGGVILIAQLSGGMLENNLFVNTKPNRVLTNYIDRITKGEELNEDELKQYELLSKSSSSFIEVDEIIIRAIKLNVPVLLDEFAYANILLKARFNVLTDGTVVFRHEGIDYDLPENFYLFLTWNPGDTGTGDIPNALKTRFPIHIIEAIDKKTHYNRIKSFVENVLGFDGIEETWVDKLYDFGNLVESHQQKMRHQGGHFTIRATQMFLSSVLTNNITRNSFELELRSKYVNAMWGSNYEMTEAINEKLREPIFSKLIDQLWSDYPIKPIKKADEPLNILDLMAYNGTGLGSKSSLGVSDDNLASEISEELDDIWADI